MPGRVVLVATSPRVPAGLLTWPAWQALRSAPVSTAAPDHRQLPFLRDADVDVVLVERADDETLAATLHDRALSGDDVVWLTDGEHDSGLVRALGLRAARGSGVEVEVVYGSWDPPGARLLDVVAVMDRLRSPGGCPWDAQQTHASLAPYLLEEAYEAYATLEEGDLAGLREELGDVLLQVVFHARLAQELPEPQDRWSVDDVAGDLVDKLVRRHPHVFAGAAADDLEGSWDAIKAREKGGRTSVTDGVPLSQPALTLARKLQKRAAKLGAPTGPPARAGDPLGVALWDLVEQCGQQRIDPEAALRSVARAFRDRLAKVEGQCRHEGREPADLTREEWAQRWS